MFFCRPCCFDGGQEADDTTTETVHDAVLVASEVIKEPGNIANRFIFTRMNLSVINAQINIPVSFTQVKHIDGVAFYEMPNREPTQTLSWFHYIPVHWTQVDNPRNATKLVFCNDIADRGCPVQKVAKHYQDMVQTALILGTIQKHGYVLLKDANFNFDAGMLSVFMYDLNHGCRLPECIKCNS